MSLPLWVSRNGALVPPAQAAISVFNPALYGAYGVYESMQVVRGHVFALDAHLDRLARSAALLELPLPGDRPIFKRWISEVLRANEALDCTLRLFAVAPENGGQATAFIWPQPNPEFSPTLYSDGASAITVEGQRAMPPAKSLNNLVSYMAHRRAGRLGVHEALLHHAGYLTEGANSNLFLVSEGVVLTTPAHQVLAGVTRDTTLALAAAHGMEMSEQSITLSDLRWATECFITSTSRHVMPVTLVDGEPIGDGCVGPVTRELMRLFAEHFERAVAAAWAGAATGG